MKLFLTSLASTTLDLIHPILPRPPIELSLAYIPTAADPYALDNRPWADSNRQKLISMGFKITDYDIKGKNEQELLSDLSKFDIIYVEGGNVFYLLWHMRQTGVDKVLPELLSKGIIYIGSSAGSAVLSTSIEHAIPFDNPSTAPLLTNYTGLGLINTQLHPHSGKPKYADREQETINKWGDKLTLLRDDQVMIVNGDDQKIQAIWWKTILTKIMKH